ncbi:LOW QUALITY PROTEIN: F-box only protein 3-like [Liolophura sinensis]|uniref:LOW QUALITY PROTEIN: F-box only protein 3-like n=1 Tax=Liolophura sinensis TaxID=3198878 RepID=UPI003158932B
MDTRHAAVKVSGILTLPAETVLYVLAHLDYRSLLRCGQCCQRLLQLSKDDGLWKRLCRSNFLVERCTNDQGWRTTFEDYFREYGMYISCYKDIKKRPGIRLKLILYRRVAQKSVLKSLNGPASEGVLESAERKIGHRLPLDLRCSLRIHNGQGTFHRNACFMNTGDVGHTPVKSEFLVDAMTLAVKYKDSGELRGCAPITYCGFSNFNAGQMIAVTEEGGHTIGEVFFPVLRREGFTQVDQFIAGQTFRNWLTGLAQALAEDRYIWQDDMLTMFYREPSCVAITNEMFRVEVATCFLPEMSCVIPPHFTFMYHITMSMSESAPPQCSCQLETRHWIITDEEGNEERVDGPGVVGMFPVMKPGSVYSWISYTAFSTTYGNMKGHFTMKNLRTGEEVNIECPCYHMKCLPYKMSEERAIKRKERKKKL